MTQSILFVCLGNICRSPMAEGALRKEASVAGVSVIVDSAGTSGWHVDQAPDERAQAVAAKNDANIEHLRGRVVTASDFHDFDHIIALDNQNFDDLRALKPQRASAELSLLMDHIDGRAGEDVVDPYYGDVSGFDQTWDEVTAAAKALLSKI